MSTRAVIYARQSRESPEGIERQLERCRALIQAKGWLLTHEYTDDDVSASKTRGNGTAWASMLASAAVPDFDVVVAVDLDRLVRSIGDLATLTASGAKVLTVDGEIDLTSADGEFRATMLAGIARFEVRRKTERQRRGNEQRAEKGIPHGRPRVFGYESDGVTPHPTESALLRDGYAHVLNGGTIRALTARWNTEGVLTTRGNRWNGTEVRRALIRERNAGILIVRGEAREESKITPIVERDVWDTVRAILLDPSRNLRGRPTGERWLSGVMSCTCGKPMLVGQSWSSGVGSAAYACQAIRLAERNGGKREGRHGQIVASIVEEGVLFDLLALLIAEAVAGTVHEIPEDAEIIRLRAVLSRIENDRLTLQELYLVPGADRAHVAQRITSLGSEHADALLELDAALSRRSAADVVWTVRDAVARALAGSDGDDEALGRAIRADWDALPVETRRQVAAAKLSIVVAPGGKGAGHGMRRVTVTPRVARDEDTS